MVVFGQELLDEAMSRQTKMLLDKVPTPCSGFTPTDFMTIVDVVSEIDAKTISPKQARLQILTLASSMDDYEQMPINMPQNPIVDQGKFGEVDFQTRFYNPLLASILADVTKKVLLRWPNKIEETVPQIRPDAIVSTAVQLRLGPSLGYGEVKPGDDNTTNQSLCIDTMKLAVLSRNAAQKNGHPIISFQVNGFHLIFFVVQELGRHLHTMLEIGRLTVSNSLASLHLFITPNNLSMLLRVTSIFWNCWVHDTPSFTSAPPSYLQETATLFSMTDKSSSKARECTIRYD